MSEGTTRPEKYDPVARALHWGMAILFIPQFAAAAAHWAFEREHPLRQALWPYHVDLGLTLFALIILRGIWGLITLMRRPHRHAGAVGIAATTGHFVLYGLMIIVPLLRILSAAGGKRGLDYFGVTILPAKEAENAWLKSLSEWHGELGWVLLAVIIGHIAMALVWHNQIKKDRALKRMIG